MNEIDDDINSEYDSLYYMEEWDEREKNCRRFLGLPEEIDGNLFKKHLTKI